MPEPPVRSRMPPGRPVVVALALGLLLGWLWPWRIGPWHLVLPSGVVLLGLFAALVVWGLRAFRRHGTSPDEKKPTAALIDTGPFRFSRNPSYVALALLMAAAGLLLNNVWILLMIIPVMITIHLVIVRKEEAYLEATFGEAYRDYKSRVRRWI